MIDYSLAKKEGILFYKIPSELTENDIDPLLRTSILNINKSGWVCTAESCQGHPDSTEAYVWANNVCPMVRLVCERKDLGKMMDILIQCTFHEQKFDGDTGIVHFLPLEIYPCRLTEHFAELIVYIPSSTVYERNVGCEMFEKFSELVNILSYK